MLIQCFPDGSHPSIHHVGRSHHVRTGFHMRESLACKQFQRGVVIHIPVFDYPAMTVIGIFAHADISDHRQSRNLLFEGTDRFLDYACLGIGVAADRVLGLWNPEQQHRRDAQVPCLFCIRHDMLDRLLIDPRH